MKDARRNSSRTARSWVFCLAYACSMAVAVTANSNHRTKRSTLTISPDGPISSLFEQSINLKSIEVYSLLDHTIRICIFAFVSGVFAGLTLGVMCANTFTLEIIAESGPLPDCKYAATVLPLRKQGHKTLCTLIISNMLCNVLIVQEFGDLFDVIEAIRTHGESTHVVDDSGSAFWKFVLSTMVIVIFAEIIPMSICRSKYSLRVAAAGSIFVKIAMILTYPISASLGWFLDMVVGEETGQLYDKKELRKLMVMHYDREGMDTNMAKSELNLLLAAMDFHERKVKDIMTPIAQTVCVKESDLVTPDFVKRLWMSGRSRVPVESTPGCFESILVVKDLMTVSIANDYPPLTVAQVVKVKDRLFVMVCEQISLPSMLKLFLDGQTHMAVVFEGEEASHAPQSASAPTAAAATTRSTSATGGTTAAAPTEAEAPLRRTAALQRPFSSVPVKITGVVTMEDVVEELLNCEIYDEYDSYEPIEDESRRLSESTHVHDNSGYPIPLIVPKEPEKPPRVNFYSYFDHPEEKTPLTEGQVWAVAYFLHRTVESFMVWQPAFIKLLLDECKDRCIIAPASDRSSTEVSPTERSVTAAEKPIPTQRGSMTSQQLPWHQQHVLASQVNHCQFLNSATDESQILYSRGLRSDVFTLVLGGRVDLLVSSDNFRSKLFSFNYIGEEAFTSPFFVPDYSAVVLTAARVFRISKDLYDKYLSYQSTRHRQVNKLRILGLGKSNLMLQRGGSPLLPRNVSRSAVNYFPSAESDALMTRHESSESEMRILKAYGTFAKER